MRIQHGLTVISPADHEQTRTALLSTWDIPGPIYYRLGKDDKTTIHGLDGRFELGRAQVVRTGNSLLMICMGSVTSEAVRAAELLARQGIECTVVVVASLNPPPAVDLADLLAQFPLALTVEAHSIVGGLGSLVSEVIAERGIGCRIVRCGVRTQPDGISGSQAFMHQVHSLSPDALCKTAIEALRRGKV